MDARTWGLAIVMATLACSPRGDRPDSEPLQQGRTYTAWLYGSEYNKLWDRFSPEMRQTFGNVAELASFAGRALRRLGAERGKVDEKVKEAEPYRVYSRSASFDNARERMLIEWSLGKDGAVTGLVVRPAATDSTTQ